MAQKIVAGNWKMNLSLTEAQTLMAEVEALAIPDDVSVMAFVPSIYVHTIARSAAKTAVGVQNFHPALKGAYTGELSIPQVESVGAHIGLIGHSERRSLFGEDHAFLKEKVDAAVAQNFGFIFCCGEPLEIREAEDQLTYVQQQLEESLFHLAAPEIQKAIIAYEPVWAIGTGKTASAAQAEEMHAAIRGWLTAKYGAAVAENVSILYGGSCNAQNASELFACPNVDGGLIGGASLDAASFGKIINAW